MPVGAVQGATGRCKAGYHWATVEIYAGLVYAPFVGGIGAQTCYIDGGGGCVPNGRPSIGCVGQAVGHHKVGDKGIVTRSGHPV